MPVNSAVASYVQGVAADLRAAGVRVEVASGAGRRGGAAAGVLQRGLCMGAARAVRPPALLPARLCCAGLSVGKAIRASEKDKIPVMCVIGQREADEGTVAVRTYAVGDQGSMPVGDLVARLSAASSSRSAF